MAIIDRIFGRRKASITISPTTPVGLPYGNAVGSMNVTQAMRLSAVYRCVEVISDSVASQKWLVSRKTERGGWQAEEGSDLEYMLNIAPSDAVSRFMLFKTLTAKVLLDGNGFIKIIRDERGDPISLELIDEDVEVYRRDSGQIYYILKLAKEKVEAEDMIHVPNYSTNGIVGVSTLFHAANSMGLSTAAESSASGFFAGGANMNGILQAESKLTPEKAKAIKDSWRQAFSIDSGEPGGIAVMEGGLKFERVTINPKDAQMLETRQFNLTEICRFFGVPPVKVFEQSGTTYNNVEVYQLGFITDTITPLDEKIESEFARKLLRPSLRRSYRLKLDINNLLRANLDSKANYMSKMFQCGGYTTNEIRAELGHAKVEGGDVPYIQVNMMPITDKNGKKD